jgi:Flp pilus assembly pilin Flp
MNNLFLTLYVKFQIFMEREDGQDTIEYALAVALIALAAVAGIKGMASGINAAYNTLGVKFAAKVA